MDLQEANPIPPTSGRRKLAFSESSPTDKAIKSESGALQNVSKVKKGKTSKKDTYDQMVLDAITENDPKRKGISFAMIQKVIKGKHMIEGNIKFYVKKSYEKLMEKKIIEQVRGTGFTGSIRLSKEHIENVKKADKLATRLEKQKLNKVAVKKGKKVDKNNNKKDGKPKKPNDAKKVNPKKTAITKTKIDRTGGKVRLSITAMPVTKVPKAKAAANKGLKAKESKSSKTKQKVKDSGKK